MAFINKTTTPLSFQGGLQSKTDALQVVPPALLQLQNGMFNKVGQLNKRFGFDTLSQNVLNGGTIGSASAIDSFNSELNLFDNQNIYTYIESNANWSNRGTAISIINTNNQITRSVTSNQLNPDCNFLGNLEFYVYEDSRSGGARYSVVDAETKAYVVPDQPLFGSRPKSVVFNGLSYLFHTDNNYNIFYNTINPNNPSILGPQTNLVFNGYSDGYTTFSYDVLTTPNYLYIVYLRNVSGPQIVINQYNTSMGLVHSIPISTLGTGAEGINAYNIAIDSMNQLWVSISINGSVQTSVFNATTMAVINAGVKIDTLPCPTLAGIEFSTPGVLQLVYEVNAADNIPSDNYIKTVSITNAGLITQLGIQRSLGLVTKPFKYGNNTYINAAHQSPEQSTYFTLLLGKTPFITVGKVAPDVGGGLRTNNMLGEVAQPSPGVFLWSNLVKGQFISEANTTYSLLGANSTTTDFTNVNKFNSVTVSNNLLFVGGILQSYDGFSANEQNFHINPENISFVVVPGAGSLSQGQYEYQWLYAWSDKFGQIQYSNPCDPIIVTCPVANCAVVWIVDTCRITAKTNVVIQGFRTQVDQTGPLQEITSTSLPLNNNTSVDYVSFTDTAADVAIQGNAPIYTSGGVFANSAPPSCSLVSLYQNRVMLAGLEDKNLIWFSKNKFDNSNFNTIPVEFSPLNTIGVDPRGGPKGITALGLMDDQLIIFKQNAIFLLTGQGPADTGTGQEFPDPELISSNCGCDNPNSIILTKDGLMFQAGNKGIWLLDRSFNLTYIGAAVDDYNSLTVSSATLDENDNLVIFTTQNGPTLVYDYYIQQWTTWVGAPSSVIDGVNFNGVYCFVKPNGQVYQQNRQSFQDAGQAGLPAKPVIMEWTTPWLSWGGMQGYQRVFRAFLLGNYRGAHQLNISVAYDFNNSFTQFATINATSLAGTNVWGNDTGTNQPPGYPDGYWGSSTVWGGIFQPYEFQINFGIQKCTSIKIQVSDSPTSPYTEGYTINSLNFEVGILGDGNRLPATNKVGTK